MRLRVLTLQLVARPWRGSIEMTNLPFPADATYLKVAEVCVLLRVASKTVRRWIANGSLPSTKTGRDWRIARSDLRAFLAARDNQVAVHVL
ncbi:MAG: excisionase family DNA binding protein [Loktanella salsilacus]